MPFEKRLHPRAQIAWPVTLIGFEDIKSGMTKNLSLAGTLVSCPEMPIIGDNFSLVFKTVDRMPLIVIAEMVWSNTFLNTKIMMQAMGVSFICMPDCERHFFSQVISNHLKLEYLKQFFTKRLSFWPSAIFKKIKLREVKCHLCKTVLLLGPTEKICPACENSLRESVLF